MEKNIGIGIKKTILGILLISIVVFSITFTYSFFIKNIDQSKGMSASLKTGNMALTFEDNDNGINKQLSFGETVTKKFKIINTGTLDASLSLDWNMLVNTYLNRSLSYNLKYSTEENGTYEEVVPETNMPTSTTPIKQALASELTVPSGTTYYYNLEITLNDLEDVEQSDDLDAVFNTKFDIGEPSKYRYYRLTIDTNGGSFEEEIQKEYLLKNEETVSISNTPTRPGYTFAGWKVQGLSSKFVDGTFTMGMSDTYLIAQWTPNKYIFITAFNCYSPAQNITNPDGTSTIVGASELGYYQDFDAITKVDNPVCEGYTFTGWNLTEGAGTLTGNTTDGYTFKFTEPGNAKIEAQWTPNNYKYIVYHNQMNVDGNGYTLVEADTDEGEAEFNTTVTPPTKEYEHFIAPSTQTLTIKHETVYPPVLNKVDYNYERNKYTVTINTNGGAYEGETENITRQYYYETVYSSRLSKPIREGYTFVVWAKEESSCPKLSSGQRLILLADVAVKACWNRTHYSVTFNANGGSTTTESKTVAYDTAYGELPTPTYEGYTFEGWYTEANGGTKVTSTTMYTTADNTTLYAHWRRLPGVDTTIARLRLTKKTEPLASFATIATTDETADGLYPMADDHGTSYYYRGIANNNFVKFGGFYWRIIRINGDGSIRMIYNGVEPSAHNEPIDTIAWSENNNDNKYVGWMYGGANGEYSTSLEQAQTNETNSDVKSLLETWYENNIETNAANSNLSLDGYIADSVFCNDRSISPSAQEWWTNESTTNRGFGSTPTAYGVWGRIGLLDGNYNKTDPKPQFTCPQGNDMFTVSAQTINGKTTNGKNGKKIGLITADEIVAAGGLGDENNQYYYLWSGDRFATLSPGSNNTIFGVDSYGALVKESISKRSRFGIIPVINLSAEASATLTGFGMDSYPFYIPGVE